jgi:Uma2 family endonuclease
VSSTAPTAFTEREYLALELASEVKHEFVDGRIVAMAGASPPHNMLAARIATVLSRLVGADCAVLSSDQRVHVMATGLYAYPDATVACAERRYGTDRPASLLNPTLIAEVTSDSTEDYDRGRKFVHYQAIGSLQHYLIVSHRQERIDHHVRLESGQWLATTHTLQDARIELLGGAFRLEDVYGGIDLTEGT